MDYEELRRYQRKEKNTAKLVELKKNFYNELSTYISKLKTQYRDKKDPEIKKKLENIKKIAKDLYKKRERKIISRTLSSSNPSQENYNLLEREKKQFKQIREVIEKGRNNLGKILEGEKLETTQTQRKNTEEPKEEQKEKQEKTKDKKEIESALETEETTEETEENTQEENEPDEGLNKVMVKILKEVPEFVSQNLQKLGPYEPESTVKVPEKEAEALVEKGFAEKTDKETKKGE